MTAILAFSAMAFQTVYAKTNYALSGDALTGVTMSMYIAQTVSFFIWGFMADRVGFKWPLMFSVGIYLVSFLLAVFCDWQYVIYIQTALFGISNGTYMGGARNLIITICRFEDRPSYLLLSNYGTFPISFLAPVFIGAIYDLMGYNAMSIICFVVLAFGIMILSRVKEAPCSFAD